MATFPNVVVKVFFCENNLANHPKRPRKPYGPFPLLAFRTLFRNRTGYRVDVGSEDLPSVGCTSQDIQPLSWLDIGLVP